MYGQAELWTDEGGDGGRPTTVRVSDRETDGRGAGSRWLWPATREHGSAVLLGHLTDDELVNLDARAFARRRPDPLPRNVANQAVLDGWVALLSPHFDADGSVNLTGTYSDAYGISHGLMLPRNVVADFLRALEHVRPGERLPWCIGVERHNTGRDVLHFHAMVGGCWSADDRLILKHHWDSTRGWSVAKSVSDSGGCVSYCAKHLLKRGAADNFDFQLTRRRLVSRHEKRLRALDR